MIGFLQSTWASDPVKKNYPSEGDSVPNFSFEFEKGKTHSFSEYNNKTVYLVFFATWCSPCRAELPHIQKEIWEKYRDDDHFKLLVIGREHTREELEKFVRENHFTFPVVPDSGRKIFSLFAPQEIPRSYLIDKTGIMWYYNGIITRSALSRLTGMNERQLGHYATGHSKPRPAQVKKIESALHQPGQELISITL
jgi:peroxiredoxin